MNRALQTHSALVSQLKLDAQGIPFTANRNFKRACAPDHGDQKHHAQQ